jgi:protein-tyrosine kinase
MSRLIELAAKRLDELRRAGVVIPGDGELPGATRELAPKVIDPREPDPSQPIEVTGVEPSIQARTQALEAQRRDIGPRSSGSARKAPGGPPSPQRRVDIDLGRLASMGYLVPSPAPSLLVDLMRVIKRPLLQNMRRPVEAGGPERRSNIVIVTSAVPGEGKTFVATNLAMSIAMEVDHSAVLIDGDVLRPSVFKRLHLPRQPGLLDLLVNKDMKATDLIVGTNVPKLSLMCAGTIHSRAEEHLASVAMDRFLDEISALYHDRLIIIDSPPLLVTTESRALAERAGQVVLVVEANRTPREQVLQAFDALSHCPIVMSVLNKARVNETDYAYGY